MFFMHAASLPFFISAFKDFVTFCTVTSVRLPPGELFFWRVSPMIIGS